MGVCPPLLAFQRVQCASARPAEQQLAAFLEQQQKNMRARIVVFASHVHNYERHGRGGVTYFVTGGGGAHAYPISRSADDSFQSAEINYHYLLVQVRRGKLKVTMNRVEIKDGVAKWTRPDSVVVACPPASKHHQSDHRESKRGTFTSVSVGFVDSIETLIRGITFRIKRVLYRSLLRGFLGIGRSQLDEAER